MFKKEVKTLQEDFASLGLIKKGEASRVQKRTETTAVRTTQASNNLDEARKVVKKVGTESRKAKRKAKFEVKKKGKKVEAVVKKKKVKESFSFQRPSATRLTESGPRSNSNVIAELARLNAALLSEGTIQISEQERKDLVKTAMNAVKLSEVLKTKFRKMKLEHGNITIETEEPDEDDKDKEMKDKKAAEAKRKMRKEADAMADKDKECEDDEVDGIGGKKKTAEAFPPAKVAKPKTTLGVDEPGGEYQGKNLPKPIGAKVAPKGDNEYAGDEDHDGGDDDIEGDLDNDYEEFDIDADNNKNKKGKNDIESEDDEDPTAKKKQYDGTYAHDDDENDEDVDADLDDADKDIEDEDDDLDKDKDHDGVDDEDEIQEDDEDSDEDDVDADGKKKEKDEDDDKDKDDQFTVKDVEEEVQAMSTKSNDLLKKLQDKTISAADAKSLLADIVSYLGGAMDLYVDLSKYAAKGEYEKEIKPA